MGEQTPPEIPADPLALAVLIVVILAMPVLATGANVYLWSVYLGDARRPRSWLLGLLAQTSTAVNVAAYWFAWQAWRRIQGDPLIPWAPVMSALAVLLLEAIPLIFAGIIWRRRHRHGRPPPFGDTD